MYNGKIIDTHMHLWDLKNNYPWLETNIDVFVHMGGNYDQLKQNFLVKDYIAFTKSHHVEKSIHLEAFGFGGDYAAETAWLQQQANQFGFPHGIIAHADLHDLNVENVLKKHCEYPNVRGIRMALNYHDNPLLRMSERGDYLKNPQWQKGFSLLAKYNLLYELQIYDHQIDDAIAVIKKYPNVIVILEHFAWPLDLSENGFKIWQQRMKKIAEFPNIYAKLSGIGWVFQKSKFDLIKKYMNSTLQIFGIDRCIFGSNFPPDSLFHNFDELIRIYKIVLSEYSEAEQYKFFYSNAEKIYRLIQ